MEAPPAGVPAPWQTQDIGAVAVAGSASFGSGTFTMLGSGADIWGSGDQFRYVYQPMSGDGEIVARVAFVENAHAWSKAGVMIRATLGAGAPQAAMLVSAGKGPAFQRRTASGGVTTSTTGGTAAAPYWVRLARTGQTVTASQSVDGVRWTVVGRDTLAIGASVYVGLAVTSHAPNMLAMALIDGVSVTRAPTPATPPDSGGWADADIGAVGAAGSFNVAGGTYRVTGGGADVWGTADALHFAYQPLPGDGQIVARVASLENVHAWTKAGVMLRGGLDAGAAQALMLVSPGKGLAFQRRPAAGAASVNTAGGAGTAPHWLRLVRTGTVITASRSLDGATWTVVGQQTLAVAGTVYVGLAVSSHDVSRAATATFDHVEVTAATAALPSGWRAVDIGGGPHGSAREDGGTFTVRGSGDVWGNADATHFAYTTLAGDGEIVARVATVENVNAWTKAGVMLRDSLDAGAAQALMLVSPGKGLAFQRRVAAAGVTTSTTGGTGAAPAWVKLTRVGQAVTASKSADGVTWTVVGRETIVWPGAVYAGLSVSSHDPGRTAAATFTDVRVRLLP